MPHYIVLANYTEQGLRSIKEAPTSGYRAEEAIESAGGRLLSMHLTMGQYDLVIIADAPNDEAMAVALLNITRSGDMQTSTLKAFSYDEMRRIIEKVR
ncbi:MAG: GYD domain-containing protein [Chloroflexi bacterium]|nr:GYD domain-containing protein [Chloroflexota bacterium]